MKADAEFSHHPNNPVPPEPHEVWFTTPIAAWIESAPSSGTHSEDRRSRLDRASFGTS
jgi:hypothetical protein